MTDVSRGLLLAGVGGQGVILAGMIVADALVRAGYDVKQSEVHGMAQRGGSVFSHVRWGPNVASPLVEKGSAEVLAAFEWAEAIRWVEYVRDGGAVVANSRTIVPPGACNDKRTWSTRYPALDVDLFRDRNLRTRLIDATGTAADLGNARAANSVMLGSLAAFLDIEDVHWEAAITGLVPKGTQEVNLAAFRAGREVPTARLPIPIPEPDGFSAPHQIDIRHEWCKGCDICERVCPEYCLAVDLDGELRIVNAEACTGCRLCEMLCPDFAISIRPPGQKTLVHEFTGAGGRTR
ncbi:MAG: 2-oxoacid:acceptor oxidoreductase family protein [Actinomycetota bacterium]|nr:2-oxoacid:acceptor oxidoreductase family protein [Actinomycetota bacterium]MDK1291343.1 2-oxoacid:acceptor oxidoreductase family protein [Actinomycetota bacterium]